MVSLTTIQTICEIIKSSQVKLAQNLPCLDYKYIYIYCHISLHIHDAKRSIRDVQYGAKNN